MIMTHVNVFLKRVKRLYKILLGILIACFGIIAGCNTYVNLFADPFLFDNPESIPENQYGLILGTSKYLVGGGNNVYFDKRIMATAELFHAGRIDQVIASGDNSDKYYNEPKNMRKALLLKGIPDSVILVDREGINTHQSVLNFIKNYNIKSVTIISQEFHNQRAIFIARKAGLNAIGYNAQDIGFFSDLKTHIREWFAKVKAVTFILL